MTDACGNCKYFKPNVDEASQDGMGWCRRKPPQIYLLDPGNGADRGPTTGTAFPYMNAEKGWCGEHIRLLIQR